MRVIIIGGGIGGLCLAHGLRKAAIAVDVYERNDRAADSLSGFGIHLDGRGCEALRACLPEASWQLFDRSAGNAGSLSRFFSESLELLSESSDEVRASERDSVVGRRRSIGRLRLREILLHGLTRDAAAERDIVHFGKRFLRYEVQPDGSVRADFEDGSFAHGDVLIGADGSNSRVRKQRLPDLQRIDTGVLNIAGRYQLTPEREASLPHALVDGSPNSIVPRGNGWLFVSAWREPDLVSGDYIVWAFADAKHNYPPELAHADAHALRDYVLSRCEGWAAPLQALIRDAELSTIAKIPLASMPRLPHWQAGSVTLLGDAIHNMTPMAGIGANTALRDAGVLQRQLSAAADSGVVVPAIAAYEQEMRVYANRAIATSTRNAQVAGSITPWRRRMFRASLRARALSRSRRSGSEASSRLARSAAMSLPTLAFVIVHWLSGSLQRAVIAALVTALATLAWSWALPELRRAALGGMGVATIGTAIAACTGEARSFFLVPVALPLAIITLCIATVLMRRPLAGMLLNRLAGGPQDWNRDPSLRRVYACASLVAAAMNVLNFSLQAYLYWKDQTGWLAATHILSGPLWALFIGGTVIAARTAIRRRPSAQ